MSVAALEDEVIIPTSVKLFPLRSTTYTTPVEADAPVSSNFAQTTITFQSPLQSTSYPKLSPDEEA